MKGVREYEEREGHASDTCIEQGLAAHTVNENQRDHGGQHIHDGDQEGCEDCILVGGNSGQSKDAGSVVDDRVDSRDLLQHGESYCDEERTAHGGTPQRAPTSLHLGREAGLYVFEEQPGSRIVGVASQDCLRVCPAILRKEPAGALGNIEDEEEEEGSGN